MKNRWKYPFIKNRRVFTIYKATAPSGKCYIGFTSRKLKYRINEHIKDTENGSKTIFHKAIRKYGNSMKFEIVNIYFNRKLAMKMEMYYIKLHNSLKSKNGYNIEYNMANETERFYTKETRKKLSLSTKKMWEDNRESLLKSLKKANKSNKVSKKALNASVEVNSKFVIDSNGVIYKSVAEAGKVNNRAECTIRDYIKHGYNLNGLKFAYYNNGCYFFKVKYTKNIKCLDNEKLYKTAKDAANDLNLKSSSGISRVCRKERNHYMNYKFEYKVGVL